MQSSRSGIQRKSNDEKAENTKVLYKVATEGLFPFNGLKERFEVAGAKAGEVVSLYDFNEDSGTVHQVLFSISVTD